ncbi:MAG TPA: ATPase domain-containing protein [Kofleriaceae bacterium]|nr:ATPase domain-containing protein [Kofleriaceae bacterium]
MQIRPVGIPSLDVLLGGGIPTRQTVIVTGDPGSGKTILCSQIAFTQAARGHNVVVATVASESHDKLIDELSGFDFFDGDRIGREVYLVSAYPYLARGPREARELLLRTVRERKADLLYLDGARSLRDMWNNESKLREFLYELNIGLAQSGTTGLITTEYSVERLMTLPEATTVDGIISLSSRRAAGRLLRRAEVVKLRGRPHITGEHVMHITRTGIEIVPRLEELTMPDGDFMPSQGRVAFGMPELDRLLDGGLPERSTTLLAGSTGVGKSVAALHFCATGAHAGEPALFVSYSEPAGRLVTRARGLSLDVRPLVDAGTLQIHYELSGRLEADDLVNDLLRRVDATGARRVVIDGIADIEASADDPARVRRLLTALIVQLRVRGVTSLFIKEVQTLAGPEVDFSDTPISVTAENMIFMRHVELRGSMRRILSVLKMRESSYDTRVHEFEITDQGFVVRGPVERAEGLLTGQARVVDGGV